MHGNSVDNFVCICFQGFAGEQCNQMDHCASSNCLETEICVNTRDSFLCLCESSSPGRMCVWEGTTGVNCTSSIPTSPDHSSVTPSSHSLRVARDKASKVTTMIVAKPNYYFRAELQLASEHGT